MAVFLYEDTQFFDNNGNPLSGGLISTFIAGTSTPKATWSESTGTSLNANPVVCDSAGRCQIWMSAAAYKIVIKTSAGVTLQTIDGYNPDTVNTTVSSLTSTGDVTLQQSTPATGVANQSSKILKVQGNYWNGAASATDEWDIQDLLGTGTNPTSTLNISHAGSGGVSTVHLLSGITIDSGILIGVGGTIQFGIGGAQLSGAGTSTVTVGSAAGVADKQIQARTVSITGATSGAVALAAPSVAGSNTATFPAATGNVVLDSATQTLTNKTVTGTGSGNSITLLSSQGATGGLVGTGADATVYTFTIPANTIQAGKGFRIKVVGFHSAGAAAVTYKIIVGSTTTATLSTADANTGNWTMSIYNAAGVQNSQFYEATMLGAGSSVLVNTFGTAAENFANAITVKFTFNVAATDQYSGKLFSIELIQ